ncbi:hypothetical protein QJS10_CPA05g00348 [Acorus calamus]|uniref:Uncharacterized protein n=1 Tax=Acorus calamus TaxID=4465 RepID=A0AAV9EXX0_ACOCL|nr:hypothetical protein QJS10_CPA05g00348 [Acorus calamus]
MAPPSADLAKIGREGFDLLEECLGKNRRPRVPPYSTAARVDAIPKKEPRATVVDSDYAAKNFGGALFVDTYRRTARVPYRAVYK